MREARIAVGLLAALPLALIAACGEGEEAAPLPRELTREATGYYCGMIVLDHPGPKAQVFVAGRDDPFWFTSVRDAIAFTMLPEEPKPVAAVYVTDMGRAESWESPGPGIWVEARKAWFVIESSRRGGMGAPEAVPFAERDAAEDLAGRYGGRVVRFNEVPRSYVFAPVGEGETPAPQ